jgi:hypothetical protein
MPFLASYKERSDRRKVRHPQEAGATDREQGAAMKKKN